MGALPVVLVVEDDRSSRESLAAALRDAGMEVLTSASGEEAMARLDLASVNVVISDIMMGKVSGVDLVTHIQEHHPDISTILVTAYGTIESAVDAMRRGAYDYLTKPINLDRLELLVQRAYRRQNLLKENRELKSQLKRKFSVAGIIGQSPPMRRILQQIEQIAPTNASVLIRGESGTGKELIASALHHCSHRSDGPLIKVSCVALAESLIESELFGHERGAFTGAHKMRQGRFEMADSGSLFLDEVGDLSISTQLKLLRAIQEREIERVGGRSPIAVDVRLIAATNQDLEKAMEVGKFREELYYRLKVVTLDVPPLRERPDDIIELLDYFLDHFCKEHHKSIRRFTPAAKQKLRSYPWPGNVRELRNCVESLVVTVRGEEITQQDLPPSMGEESGASEIVIPMGRPLEEVEKRYILRTLEMLGNNKARTAQALGISKKTLYRRLHEYGIPLGDEEEADPVEVPPTEAIG
jgi:DNA-binding NtrC family response regulator